MYNFVKFRKEPSETSVSENEQTNSNPAANKQASKQTSWEIKTTEKDFLKCSKLCLILLDIVFPSDSNI